LRGAPATSAKPERGPGEPVAATFKAPLLAKIFDTLDGDQRQVALDLGAPCQALLSQLTARRGCRLEIADLVANDGLRALNAALPEARAATMSALLPQPNRERLTLIFCWDLPNYLGLAALHSLCTLLASRAAPGCRLHMLISYSRRDMPLLPAHYTPGGDGQLTQLCLSDERTPAPRYSPEDLGKALGGFRYQRGVLLANGMQEFVYAWPDGQA
jgi:hypothetical protein